MVHIKADLKVTVRIMETMRLLKIPMQVPILKVTVHKPLMTAAKQVHQTVQVNPNLHLKQDRQKEPMTLVTLTKIIFELVGIFEQFKILNIFLSGEHCNFCFLKF